MNVHNLNWQYNTILVAEDDKDCFKYIYKVLEPTMINILWAQNGVESVNFCKTNRNIDLVLMDTKMPVMSGFEATLKIKDIREDLFVIIQTTYTDEYLIEEFKKIYFDGFIRKPVNRVKLISIISNLINRSIFTKQKTFNFMISSKH